MKEVKCLQTALYRLSKIRDIQFYLIGPYFNGFSQNFLKKTNTHFNSYKAEIVQKDELDLSLIADGTDFEINGKKIKEEKR